ncbi:TonB family protein [Dyadobacter sp. 676]|uniref:TonB family protein n=1 Tax=Dyadobacter sp. 676 TaxID=3088362 RepID=A0AAU8FK03_9BACT
MLQRIPEPLFKTYLILSLAASGTVAMAATSSISDSLDVCPAIPQTARIWGKITDESSRPVANAAVLVAESERVTVSNLSGGFEIADAPLNGVLLIKHPDFETRQVPIVKSAAEYAIILKSRTPLTAIRQKSQARASRKDSEVSHAAESSPSMRVDRWPYFPGGYKGLNKFLANNLKYPSEALQNRVEGAVQVSFLLDEDGNVSSGRIIDSPGAELDEEALRLVSMMPRWTPAQKDGKPIAVWYTISIHFDPQVDKLPLKIKEEVPKFFSRRMKPDLLKAPFPTKDELEKLFRKHTLNVSVHEPPRTKLYMYGHGIVPRPTYVPLQLNFRPLP